MNNGLMDLVQGTVHDIKKYLEEHLDINTGIIGEAGAMGFGVGVCPVSALPAGFVGMPGHTIKGHDNYGNYKFREGSIMCFIPKFYYREHTWAANQITAITKANPGVVTQAAHGYVTGNKAFLCNIGGMTQLNGVTVTVTRIDDNSYSIGVDTSTYTAFTSGGDSTKGFGADYEFNSTLATYLKNSIEVKGIDTFPTISLANAAGYALHRAFIDGGKELSGFFVDKYKCSKVANGTGYTAASTKNGLPLSAAADHNPFSGCTGGVNAYYSALDLAHRRDGVNGAVNPSSIFFARSQFIAAALAIIVKAHGQKCTSDTNCAWYHATYNYPKGCNNNSLKDAEDATVTYISDGYSNCGKTGSGTPFAKTTHNGQNCGVADLNGLMWEISTGLTCIATTAAIESMSNAAACVVWITNHGLATGDFVRFSGITQANWTGANDKIWAVTKIDDNTFSIPFDSSAFGTAYDAATDPGVMTSGKFYTAKQSVAMKSFTGDNTLATDHWGATGVSAMMEAVVPPFKASAGFDLRYGSGTNQVLSPSLSGAGWVLAGMGFPASGAGVDTTGTNLFGKDYFYQYIQNEMCLRSCAGWGSGGGAGVWGAFWSGSRGSSSDYAGFRSACYPEG